MTCHCLDEKNMKHHWYHLVHLWLLKISLNWNNLSFLQKECLNGLLVWLSTLWFCKLLTHLVEYRFFCFLRCIMHVPLRMLYSCSHTICNVLSVWIFRDNMSFLDVSETNNSPFRSIRLMVKPCRATVSWFPLSWLSRVQCVWGC